MEDCTAIYNKAVSRGAKSLKAPEVLKDEHGSLITASVHTYGDTIHSFVQRVDYKGFFMPGYIAHPLKDALNNILPPINYNYVDHVVGNQPVYLKLIQVVKFRIIDDFN